MSAPKSVRDMSASAYAAARRQALQDDPLTAPRDRADHAAMRKRHPDLAAKADADALAAQQTLVKQLATARAAMEAAHAVQKATAGQPSVLERERASQQLAEAVAIHDALLLDVEAGWAALAAA
jgi:hypothetical protein